MTAKRTLPVVRGIHFEARPEENGKYLLYPLEPKEERDDIVVGREYGSEDISLLVEAVDHAFAFAARMIFTEINDGNTAMRHLQQKFQKPLGVPVEVAPETV